MLRPGEVVGNYVVEDVLGEGGAAIVYRVRHVGLDAPFALKALWPWHVREDITRERFHQEALILAKLRHPSLVRVTDIVASADPPVAGMVMDLLEGRTLGDVVDEGPVPVEQAVNWTAQVLEVLAYIHGQGVVHRDVKPANLHLDDDGVVKLMDFGIAQVVDRRRTRTRATLGTPGYMAPEQIRSAGRVDARTDLFAAGVVLYELLTARQPFVHGADDTDFDIQLRATDGLWRDDPRLDPVRSVIARALQVDPADRFESADQMRAALGQEDDVDVAVPRGRFTEWVYAVASVRVGPQDAREAVARASRRYDDAPPDDEELALALLHQALPPHWAAGLDQSDAHTAGVAPSALLEAVSAALPAEVRLLRNFYGTPKEYNPFDAATARYRVKTWLRQEQGLPWAVLDKQEAVNRPPVPLYEAGALDGTDLQRVFERHMLADGLLSRDVAEFAPVAVVLRGGPG